MKPRGLRWIWLDHVCDRVRDGTLNSHADHVALKLASRYTNSRGQGWPSQRELAQATGLSERTVRRAIHDLEQIDLLAVRSGRPAGPRGHVYTLLIPATQSGINGVKRPLATGHTVRMQPATQSGKRPQRQSVGAKAS